MKLLLLSPDSWSVFFPETQYVFGGIETETGYYARILTEKHDVKVTVVTRDQGNALRFSGRVKVVAHPQLKGDGYWKKRKTVIGKIQYRLGGMKDSGSKEDFYAQLNPDVVFVQGPSPEALFLLDYCKKNNRRFVFRIASDLDIGGEPGDDTMIEQWSKMKADDVFRLITEADLLLAQSPFQQERLKSKYGRDSEVLFNPLNLETKFSDAEKKYDLLWIGKNLEVKQPEIFLGIAEEFPQLKSCFICNKLSENGWDELMAKVPKHVEFLPFVSPEQIESYFASSRLLVNTSKNEGFANTFLQAGKYGVPVISLNSDPNGMLTKHGAGAYCRNSREEMKKQIEHYLQNKEAYASASDSARRYVSQFHDAENIVAHLAGSLHRLI